MEILAPSVLGLPIPMHACGLELYVKEGEEAGEVV